VKLSKRLRYSILGVTIAGVAAVGYLWVRPFYWLATAPGPEDRCPGHERFEAATWRDTLQAYSELAPRGCMVDDLLNHHKLVGLDRSGVIALLGQPTRTEYFREYDLVYWLGPERGLWSIDSEWLVLKLDASGRVIDARLVTD
jgi:hypothetical protein